MARVKCTACNGTGWIEVPDPPSGGYTISGTVGPGTLTVHASDLIYESDIVGPVSVPAGFETDLASVPRLIVIYELWGNRCHREAVIHDYLYRIDSVPQASKLQADRTFLEAMKVRGKPFYIRWFMFAGVAAFA